MWENSHCYLKHPSNIYNGYIAPTDNKLFLQRPLVNIWDFIGDYRAQFLWGFFGFVFKHKYSILPLKSYRSNR